MLAKFRRLSFVATPCKVEFTIDLKELTITDIRDEITLLCVELEKKTKSVSSSSKLWTDKTSPSRFLFNETLTIVVTLYRDASGVYREKKAKVILRGHSKILKAAIPLASYSLKLHALAADFDSRALLIELKDVRGNTFATLDTTVTSKFLRDVSPDDDMSVISGDSDNTAFNTTFNVRHTAVYKDTYEPQLKCENMSKNETDKLRLSLRNIRTELDTSSMNSSGIFRDLEQSNPPSPPEPIILAGRRRVSGIATESARSEAEITLRSKIAQLQYDLEDKSNQHLAVVSNLVYMERRASLAEQRSSRLFEDLELASGQMDEGKLKDHLFDKMALSSEVEKSKEETLCVSVEKEKLRMDLIESKNNMLLLQSRLDAAQLENAAVQAAVLSIEIQKLNASIKQYKEQAHISATEKKGLMNEIESIRNEAAEADTRNKRIRHLETENNEVAFRLAKSSMELSQHRVKVETLQTNVADLKEQLTAMEDQSKFFQNAAFANTKKNESEKADLQVKLSSTQVKLDAALAKIEAGTAERDKNNKKAEEDIKALTTTVVSLEAQLEESSHKGSSAVASNIAASIKNKKDIAALTDAAEEKDAEISVFKKQSAKTVMTLSSLSKAMAGMEQQSEAKCKHLSDRLARENDLLKHLECELRSQFESNSTAAASNAVILEEKAQVEELLQQKSEECRISAVTIVDSENQIREHKAECFKVRIELGDLKQIIDKLTTDIESLAVSKSRAVKDLDVSNQQVSELKADKELLVQEGESAALLVEKNDRAEAKIEELGAMLTAADDWQSTITQEVEKLQAVTDNAHKELRKKEELLEALEVQMALETRDLSDQLASSGLAAASTAKAHEGQIATLQQSVAALSLTVEEKETLLKSVSAELETTQGQVVSLTEQTIAQEKKATDLSGLLSSFKDKLRNDREQGAASMSDLTDKMQLELQTAKEEHDLRDAEKSKTIANTMKELADTKVRLSEVLAESGTHSKESEEASRQVVQLTGEVARLEADVSSAQTALSTARCELDDLQAKSTSQTRDLSDQLASSGLAAASTAKAHEGQIATLQQSVAALSLTVEEKETLLKSVSAELETTQGQVVSLTEQTIAQEKKATDLSGLLSSFKDKLRNDREQGAASMSDLTDKMQLELQTAKEEHDLRDAEKSKTIANTMKELADTKVRLSEVLAESGTHSKESEEASRQVVQLTGEVARLEADVSSAQTALSTARCELDDLQAKSTSQTRDLSDQLASSGLAAASTAKAHEGQIATLQQSVAALSLTVEEKETLLKSVSAELETTQGQVVLLTEQTIAQEKKATDLSGLLSSFKDKLRNDREQGAASMSDLTDKMQLELQTAKEEHDLRDAEKSKTIANTMKELADTKVRLSEVLAESGTHSKESEEASRQVVQLTGEVARLEADVSSAQTALSTARCELDDLQAKSTSQTRDLSDQLASSGLAAASTAKAHEGQIATLQQSVAALSLTVEEKETLLKSVSAELETTQGQVVSLTEQTIAQEKKATDLSGLLSSFKDKLRNDREQGAASMSDLTDKMQLELQTAKEEHDLRDAEKSKTIANTMKELADTKVRLSEVLAESGTHSKESEEASRQVVQLTGEVARLEADVSSAQTALSTARCELDDLQAKSTSQTRDLSDQLASSGLAAASTAKAHEGQIATLQQSVAALSLTVEEKETLLKSVSAELETTQGQVVSLTEQTIAQEKKATDLSGLLSSFKDKLRNDREQGAASMSDLTDKMQLELQTAKEEHDLRDAEKSKTIANTMKELADTKVRLSEVLAESGTHSKESEEASRQVVQLTGEVARLEADVSSAQTALSTARCELDDLQAKSTSQTRDLSDQLASSGLAAASTAKAHEGQIATLQQSVAALSLTVEEKETLLKSVSAELETTQGQVVSLTEQTIAQEKKATDLSGLLSSFKDKLRNDREQGAASMSDLTDKMQLELQTAKEEHDLRDAEKSKTIANTMKELADTKVRLSEVLAESGTHSKESEEASRQVVQLTGEVARLEADVSSAQTALSTARCELDDLQAKSTSQTRDLSDQLASSGLAAASTAKAHEGQIATLQQSVAALSLTVEEKETLLKSVSAELETTQGQVVSLTEQTIAQEKKATDLSGLLSSFKDKLRNDREQGAASMSDLTDKMQLELQTAKEEHDLRDAEKSKTIANTMKELADTKVRLSEVLAESGTHSKESEEASRQVVQLTGEVARLEADVSSAQTALSTARCELDDLQAKSTSQTRDLSDQLASSGLAAASTAKAHEGQIATLQQSVAALSLTVEEKETLLKSVSAELETTQGQVVSLTEQTIAQEKKATDLSGLLSSFKDKLRNDREQGAASMSDLTDKMQLELQTAKEEHDLRDAEKSKTIANTMKELADTKVRLSEVLAESGTHSKESEEASRQVVQLTGEVARLEADVSSAQTEKTYLCSQICSLQSTCDSQMEEITLSSISLQKSQAEVAALAEQTESTMKSNSFEIEKMLSENRISTMETSAQITRYQEDVETARSEIKSLEDSLRAQLLSSKASDEAKRGEIDSKVREIKVLEESIIAVTSSSQNALLRKDEQVEHLEILLSEAKSMDAATHEEMRQLILLHNDKIVAIIQQSNESELKYDTKIAALEGDIVKAKKREEAQAAEIVTLQIEKDRLLATLAQAELKTVAAERRIETMTVAEKSSTLDILSLTEKMMGRQEKHDRAVDSYEGAAANMSSEIKGLQDQLSALKVAQGKSVTEICKLECEVGTLQSSRTTMSENLEREIGSLKQDLEKSRASLFAEVASRKADRKDAEEKLDLQRAKAREQSAANASAADEVHSELSKLYKIKADLEAKNVAHVASLSTQAAHVAQLKQEIIALQKKSELDALYSKKETNDKVSIVRDEVNILELEKKVLGDTLTRKVEETARELAASKKEISALDAENSSIRRDLEKSLMVNDTLKTNSSKDTLRVMRENASLLEKNQSLLSIIEENKVSIAASEEKTRARLLVLAEEKKILLEQLAKSADVISKNDETSLEMMSTSTAEKNKLKAELKALQHKILSDDVMRKDELLKVTKEKENVSVEMDELKARLAVCESKLMQNAELFEAEKSRIFTLENSKAQIAAAEAKINFSTEKRKLKEEISELNIRINQVETEAMDSKSKYSSLETKMEETLLQTKASSLQSSERIITLLKAANIFDASIHCGEDLWASGSWTDVIRVLLESQKEKLTVLPKLLERFKDKLAIEDIHGLSVVGVTL